MGYAKDYDRLLTPDGYKKIRKMIDNGEIISDYKILEFKMAQHDDLKFFSAVIDTDDNEVTFCAYLLVTYLEKDLLFPHVKDKRRFPVMIIVTPSKMEKTAAGLNDKDITLKHELLHLKDLRDIFDKEPSFIMKGCRNALVNAGISGKTEHAKLAECIDYEVEKIFRIEPQAMKQDFELGNRKIIIPLDEFRYIEHQCQSSIEYVKYEIIFYLASVKSNVIEKVKDNNKLTDSVNDFVNESICKHGTNVFGKNTMVQFKAAACEMAMLMFSKRGASKMF